MDNRVEIIVGARDDTKLDLDGLRARLQAVAKTYEAKLKVAVDKNDIATVDRIGANLANLSRRLDSSRFGESAFNRAHASLSRMDADLENLAGSGASGGLMSGFTSALAGLGPVAGLSGTALLAVAAAAVVLATALAPVLAALIPITIGFAGLGVAAAPVIKDLTAFFSASSASQKKAAWKAMDPAEQHLAEHIQAVGKEFAKLADKVKPEIIKAFDEGLKILQQLMPALEPLMKAAGKAVDAFLHSLLDWLKSPSGKAFINWLKTEGPHDIQVFGRIMWDVAVGIGLALDHIYRAGKWLDDHLGRFFTVDIPNFLDILKEKWRIVFDQMELAVLSMVHGSLDAMSHIPFIGHYFKQAADDVGAQMRRMQDDIRQATRNIQGDLNAIHGKHVTVAFGLSGSVAGEGNLGKIKGFASGTSGASSGWAWVGERGPELVKMRGGEQVIPNHVLKGFAGGTGFDFTDVISPSVGVFGKRLATVSNSIEDALVRAIHRIAAREVASGSLPTGPHSASAAIAQRYAASILGRFGWGMSQFPPLQALWNQESGWNAYAVNPSSGAYGIPQALGHGHPFNLGDYVAQIWWGLRYIAGRYGSPAAAEAHEMAVGWYDHGGYLKPGWTMAYNGTGKPEPVGAAIGSNIVLDVQGTGPLAEFLRLVLRNHIRTRYGGNVNLALGN